ncbi:MAG TPA: FAD-dependent oxidoreductase [Trebonia sp.]|nr:FAD-dependent oxidoreductase [Trebonia sp.]
MSLSAAGMPWLKVAIVGSGPAGLYTAEALVKQAALLPSPVKISVDVLDRLPTPYGLVRYGVAPDHKSIKSVANYLRRVLESPGVTFAGGVHFGTDVTREDLLASYDAVVYATGAMRDRRLGIPGEDLPGSYAATDFVNWYCGHPDIDPGAFTLDAESVAVIGVGNVAVDVARILARDPVELEQTDIPEPVMAALRASKVREVHVIGRRGPAQAKFTTKELRELGELPGVQVSADPAELDLTDGFDRAGESAALASSDRRVRGNLVALAGWSGVGDGTSGDSAPDGPLPGRRLRLRFWLRPVEIQESSSGTVAGLRLERTRLSESGVFEGTGEFQTLPAQMVLRSVGYQSVPLPGVPFDERTHTVPNLSGRVVSEAGEPLPGEYVAGWLKRGPTGVIGTNKADAAETVQALLADLAGGPDLGEGKLPRPGLLRRPGSDDPEGPGGSDPDNADPAAAAGAAAADSVLAPVLAGRGVTPVGYRDWLRIAAAEEALAASLGRGERVKLPHRDAIWSAARTS